MFIVDITDMSHFLPLYHFLNSVFEELKFFILMKSNLLIFFFYCLFFLYFRNICQAQGNQGFPPMFSSGSFIVLALIGRSRSMLN